MNIIPISALTDNYIWMLVNTSEKKAWAVDPGVSAPVIKFLAQNELSLAGILLTHHHGDHSGGIAELVEFSGEIPVYGSYQSPIKLINHSLKENDECICAESNLRVLEIPGHTLDHLAYFNDHILFCGDTLFSVGCGKVFEGTYPQMFLSLQKLLKLADQTLVYCGHEYTLANLKFAHAVDISNKYIVEKIANVKNIVSKGGCSLPSTIGEEKKINPFLRCDVPEIIHAVQLQYGKKLNDPAEVFHLLREWKNNFT